MRGWITRRSDLGFDTEFVAVDGSALKVAYDVRAKPGDKGAASILDPLRPLDVEGVAMFNARMTAVSVLTGPCGDTFNTVVLPGAVMGKEGWLVWLLASTRRSDQIVLAGHHRVQVSADGLRVVQHVPLSRGCTVSDGSSVPAGMKRAALWTTMLVADHPLESEVFNSLHYKLPIYVLAAKKMWLVDGDQVTRDAKPPGDAPK